MPRPTITVKADLNGTGVLVDLGAYVDAETGVTHGWGRQDWTTAEPSPGSITIELDNRDGRFTPGRTTNYLVGCREGVLVEWACDTRVRRVRMGTPVLSFPNGGAASSVVTVTCQDVLAPMSARVMRSMLDESVQDAKPFAYWALNESGSGVEPRPVDSSGRGQPTMVPYAATEADAAAFGWTNGGGPPFNDGQAALHMWGDAVPGALPFPHQAGQSVDLLAPVDGWTFTQTGTFPATGTRTYRMTVAAWVTIKAGVYDTSNPGGNVNTGQHALLLSLGKPNQDPALAGNYSLLWRARDQRFRIADRYTLQPQSGTPVTMTPGDTHFLVWQVLVQYNAGNREGVSSWVSVDGAAPVQITGAYTPGLSPWAYWAVPTRLQLGSTEQVPIRIDHVTDPGVYADIRAHVGTISRVAVYSSTTMTPTNAQIADQAAVGLTDTTETPQARVARIEAHLGLPAVVVGQGTPQPTLLPWQDTAGQSMLAAAAAAMAGEGGGFDCATIAGVETIRCWLDSTQRQLTSAFTVDVQFDAEGVPDLSFDTSGVTNTATAKGRTTTALYIDRAAPVRWQGAEVGLDSAYNDALWLASLAQYRTTVGRTDRLSLAAVTVDMATSETDLLAALLAVRPGLRITVTGLPVAVTGYASIDCYIIGGSEIHNVGQSSFTLFLQPVTDAPEAYTDPLDGSIPDRQFRLENEGYLTWASMTAGSSNFTTINTAQILAFWSQDAGDYPMVVQVHSEQISLNAAPAVAGSVYTWAAANITRAVNGTVAAAHASNTPIAIIGTDAYAAF